MNIKRVEHLDGSKCRYRAEIQTDSPASVTAWPLRRACSRTVSRRRVARSRPNRPNRPKRSKRPKKSPQAGATAQQRHPLKPLQPWRATDALARRRGGGCAEGRKAFGIDARPSALSAPASRACGESRAGVAGRVATPALDDGRAIPLFRFWVSPICSGCHVALFFLSGVCTTRRCLNPHANPFLSVGPTRTWCVPRQHTLLSWPLYPVRLSWRLSRRLAPCARPLNAVRRRARRARRRRAAGAATATAERRRLVLDFVLRRERALLFLCAAPCRPRPPLPLRVWCHPTRRRTPPTCTMQTRRVALARWCPRAKRDDRGVQFRETLGHGLPQVARQARHPRLADARDGQGRRLRVDRAKD